MFFSPRSKKSNDMYGVELKNIALKNGALGTGISGSGPSVFSLCKSETFALDVEKAIRETYKKENMQNNILKSKREPQIAFSSFLISI